MVTTSRRFRCVVLALVVCANLAWLGMRVAAASAVMRIQPSQGTVNIGQLVDLQLVIEQATGIWGVEVLMTFDPSILEVVDTNAAEDGVQVVPGPFPSPDFVATKKADNTAGTIWYAATQVNPREPASGSGIVMTARLRAKASGTSLIDIAQVILTDRDARQFDVLVQGAQIAVLTSSGATPPPASTRTPTPPPTATTTPPATPTQIALPGWTPPATPTQENTPMQPANATPQPSPASAQPSATPTQIGAYPLAGQTASAATATPTRQVAGLTITPGATFALMRTVTPREVPTRPPVTTPTARPTSMGQIPTVTQTASVMPTGTQASAMPADKVALLVPTAEPLAPRPAQSREQLQPLIPQEMFSCLVTLLVLFTLGLLFYLIRQQKRGER